MVLVDFGGMPAPVLLLYRKFMLIDTRVSEDAQHELDGTINKFNCETSLEHSSVNTCSIVPICALCDLLSYVMISCVTYFSLVHSP